MKNFQTFWQEIQTWWQTIRTKREEKRQAKIKQKIRDEYQRKFSYYRRSAEEDLELWKHHASFGGEDKNRMVTIATWLLGG